MPPIAICKYPFGQAYTKRAIRFSVYAIYLSSIQRVIDIEYNIHHIRCNINLPRTKTIATMTSSSSRDGDEVKAELIPPIPTPHWGSQSGSSFTVRATTTINTLPQPVLDALLDTSTWPQWNNFVPRCSITETPNHSPRLHPGTIFTEHVDMAGRGRSTIVKMKLLMTSLDELQEPTPRGFKVVWLGKGYPDWALRTERVHEIYVETEGGGTVYDVYETFSGPLAWLVKFFVGATLVKRFGQWNGELKAFVEGKQEGS